MCSDCVPYPSLADFISSSSLYKTVSQPPSCGPVPGPGINYTGPREIPLELITKCNFIFVNMPHRTHNCTNTLYDYAIINY